MSKPQKTDVGEMVTGGAFMTFGFLIGLFFGGIVGAGVGTLIGAILGLIAARVD